MENIKNIAKALGSLGGKKSAKNRFAGKSKKEISELMRKVRLTSEQKKKTSKMAGEFTRNLNRNVQSEQDSSKP